MVICAGLDLAAKENRASGISVAVSRGPFAIEMIKFKTVYSDRDILSTIIEGGVSIVAIDSPLSLPPMKSYREIDLKLKRMGFNVLPPVWRSMRELTLRAIRLADTLRSTGIEVIETHPSSCLKSSGCNTFERLAEIFRIRVPTSVNKDERDSIIALIACTLYSFNRGLIVSADDGAVVLVPRLCQ